MKSYDILLRPNSPNRARPGRREAQVLLVIHPVKRKHEEKLHALIRSYMHEGIKITVGSFYPEREAGMIRRIEQSTGVRIFNLSNHFDIVHKMKHYRVVIGLRYHALILAYNEGCNILPVALYRRMREFSYELGLRYISIETMRISEIIRETRLLFQNDQKTALPFSGEENRLFLKRALTD